MNDMLAFPETWEEYERKMFNININPNWLIYYYAYATPVIARWLYLYER